MVRIILFDGECNFCEWNVQFIIKRDPKAIYKFAPLQSDIAQKLMGKSIHNYPDKFTVILIEGNKIYTQSTAALRISKHLKKPWPFLYLLIIIPRPLRNLVYQFIAKNRYKWFGKKDQCMIPTPQMKKRFL